VLQKFYEDSGAYPFIPVWNTGPVAVLQDIWVRIAQETLFRILLDRVTGLVHARMSDFVGSRGGGVDRTLGPVTVAVAGEGDFPAAYLNLNLDSVRGKEELALREFQEESIKAQMETDVELNTAVDAVLRGANLPVAAGSRAPGINSQNQSVPSLADTAALEPLQKDANTRGLGLGTAVAVLKIVVKVIGRFIRRADHGLHATVVEEVLRAFYLGSVGTAAWSKMKDYTQWAFSATTTNASGIALIEELQKIPAAQRVMLVGHSAGSIFISELLQHFPDSDRKFEVVFLAPAVTVELFVQAVVQRQHLLAKNPAGNPLFRMYTMNDFYESRDVLVRNVPVFGDLNWFYPRSLLYLISGILEETAGKEVVDAAITGLQRVYDPTYRSAAVAEVAEARAFVEGPADRRVWAVAGSTDPRMRSNSTSHGGFGSPDSTNMTMLSVAALLSAGW
jgi:pimeloyl-ACP methyl ester carboxylesterase